MKASECTAKAAMAKRNLIATLFEGRAGSESHGKNNIFRATIFESRDGVSTRVSIVVNFGDIPRHNDI
jgi:hypothetical protein